MNKRYCSHCGHANLWELVKPKVCAKCDANMDSAFAGAAPVATTPAAPAHVQAAPVPYARPNRPVRRPADATFEGEESDYLDRVQAEQEAQELAASIRGQIKVSLDEKPKSVRFGDLENVQRMMREVQAAPQPKRRRR